MADNCVISDCQFHGTELHFGPQTKDLEITGCSFSAMRGCAIVGNDNVLK